MSFVYYRVILIMFTSYLKLFLQIMLLRKGPQDVPYSTVLPGLLLIVVIALQFLVLLLPDSKVQEVAAGQIIGFILVNTAIGIGGVYLLLRVLRQAARAVQTLSAWLGVSIIFGVAHLLLHLLWLLMQPLGEPIGLLSLILLGWSLVVDAHIFRQALSISWLAAGMLAFCFFMISLALQSTFGLLGS